MTVATLVQLYSADSGSTSTVVLSLQWQYKYSCTQLTVAALVQLYPADTGSTSTVVPS